MKIEFVDIKTKDAGELGSLSFFEGGKDVPFNINRIYYIHNVPKNVKRGAHAHKKLMQLLFCPYGCVEIVLDDGKEKERVVLDDPAKGVILYPGIWRDMIWHIDNSVLCVAASEYYDENDYIRDYEEFLKYVSEKE